MTGYGPSARARLVAEPAKRAAAERWAGERSDFARDRARVLHSYAFRRLADKTQVVVPGEDDFPRTRLTHSLEVAQIGREIALALGCDADVVDAAGLAHDIGHPPFGHNGEQALDAVAQECGGFEGNAQTLRVLTRLEVRALRADGASAGLNLTRAVLDATCKYPWPRRAGTPKFGRYEADLAAFDWLRADAVGDAVGERRCLEAQVMDWADDVAYSVHDVEDGVHAGQIMVGAIGAGDRERLCEIAARRHPGMSAAELAPVLDALLALAPLVDLGAADGSYRAQAAAKRATSELVGRFAGAAVDATRAAHGPGPFARYAADLVVPAEIAAECALLKALAVHYVMHRPGIAERQAEQRALLTRLVDRLRAGAPGTLDQGLRADWHAAPDDAARLRVVIDQVAQLTDTSAAAREHRLAAR
ncbi:deoxyguanosinetriphosphate triphosphohydrolase [uncultured Jatrophihabitans sp.]|uniref:deoxyguanosinetriphosphate triphosphohydrolase n=1 Tax=uncultured Jatrophihabitans sp. TaxID=1610747 RepID=UPI0035CBBF44